MDAAERVLGQVKLDVAWAEWRVALTARQAVRDLQAYLAQRELAAGIRDRLREAVDGLLAALEKGDVTGDTLASAEAAERDAALAVATTDRLVRLSRLSLNRALGLPPEADPAVEPAAAPPPVPDLAALTDGLAARRLDLRALRQGYLAQEAQVRAAVLGQFPSFSLGLTTARDTGRVGTIGIGLSIGLPIFDGNRGQVALERANRETLFREYAAAEFGARADLAAALADAEALGVQAAAAAETADALQRLFDGYRAAAAAGDVNAATLYLAQNDLTRQRIAVLELTRQRAAATTAIELTAGVLLPTPTRAEPAAPAPATPDR